jgi:carbon-monoxide dehydrogenase small subunit
MMKRKIVNFKVNDELHEVLVEPNVLLVNVLREELGLTGTKYSTGQSQFLS